MDAYITCNTSVGIRYLLLISCYSRGECITFWSWVSRRRHEEVIQYYIQHVDKIIKVTEHAKKIIEAFMQNDRKSAENEWSEVFRYEKEADDIKRQILSELSREIFHPIDREDIIRLVLTSDDIAAYAKAWSRRLILLSIGSIPQDILNKLFVMASKVHEATLIMRGASEKLMSNPKEVLELANKIEALEEEVDDIRHEVFKDILNFCEQTKISQCLMAKEVMDSIENSADKCEDVADVLRSIALLSL
jgi:predicted phosphate transport protein (TIGR00153 family)